MNLLSSDLEFSSELGFLTDSQIGSSGWLRTRFFSVTQDEISQLDSGLECLSVCLIFRSGTSVWNSYTGGGNFPHICNICNAYPKSGFKNAKILLKSCIEIWSKNGNVKKQIFWSILWIFGLSDVNSEPFWYPTRIPGTTFWCFWGVKLWLEFWSHFFDAF